MKFLGESKKIFQEYLAKPRTFRVSKCIFVYHRKHLGTDPSLLTHVRNSRFFLKYYLILNIIIAISIIYLPRLLARNFVATSLSVFQTPPRYRDHGNVTPLLSTEVAAVNLFMFNLLH